MARRMADSATKMKCMKNIWDTQLPKDMFMDWNQKMASILGSVVEERTRSMAANMAKKRYMGSWRAASAGMMKKRVQLPRRAKV